MNEFTTWSALASNQLFKNGLDTGGDHGVPHWVRVHDHGVRLAKETGANLRVVKLFAAFHDCCRENEHEDPEHGKRAAEFVTELALRGSIKVSPEELALLTEAIRYHSNGTTEADVTVQTCWDADRLDLGRVGITPTARWLCTDAAKRLTIKESTSVEIKPNALPELSPLTEIARTLQESLSTRFNVALELAKAKSSKPTKAKESKERMDKLYGS